MELVAHLVLSGALDSMPHPCSCTTLLLTRLDRED